jgi:CheY-like chemotaxis protein
MRNSAQNTMLAVAPPTSASGPVRFLNCESGRRAVAAWECPSGRETLPEGGKYHMGSASEPVKLRVLIVEDEALIRWAVAEALTDAGHSVTQAWDKATALRALSEAPSPDVVLLDFRLPDSNDLSLLAAIRRRSPSSAVVMMTAHGTPETIAGARAMGAYRVMAKPFDLREVEAVLVEAYRAVSH